MLVWSIRPKSRRRAAILATGIWRPGGVYSANRGAILPAQRAGQEDLGGGSPAPGVHSDADPSSLACFSGVQSASRALAVPGSIGFALSAIASTARRRR